MKLLSHVRLFAIPWTVVYQVSLSMGFSRQEYWSGLPLSFPSPGDLPDPGIEPRSPTLQSGALTSEPSGKPPQKNLLKKQIRIVDIKHLSCRYISLYQIRLSSITAIFFSSLLCPYLCSCKDLAAMSVCVCVCVCVCFKVFQLKNYVIMILSSND